MNQRIEIDLEILNRHTTKKNFDEFLDWLDETHDEWEREKSTSVSLLLALETFLQACGVEGYEFS